MIKITSEKISTYSICPRRYDQKFNVGAQGRNVYWKMRNEAFSDILEELIVETRGSVGVLLVHDVEDIRKRCQNALTYMQLKFRENIPLSHYQKFLTDFETFWENLKKVLNPYKHCNMIGRREYELKLPSFASIGIKEKFKLEAVSSFTLVSEDTNIIIYVNFSKKPFRKEESDYLKFLNYVYFLNTGETPNYVGMLFLASSKIKFLDKHLYKQEYILLYKKEILKFIQGITKGNYTPEVCSRCPSCSYAPGCFKYAQTKKRKEMNFDTEVPLGVLV